MIPCVPKDAREDLYRVGLGELLGHYVNWADRNVPPRRRRVVTWDGFLRHGSPLSRWDAVKYLVKKIETGEDLKPFLSDRVERFDYVPRKFDKGNKRRGVEWQDKDYVLNAFETHHLHLSTNIRSDGWSGRSRALLYVNFSRDDAFLVMVGDHNSFDDGTLAQAICEARVGTSHEIKGVLGPARRRTAHEQNKLQRHGLSTVYEIGGHTVIGAMLSTMGTSLLHRRHADRIIETIKELEPQLDSPGFGYEWFKRSGKPYPETPAFEWAMEYCDFFLVETTTAVGFPMVKWRR